MNLLVLLFGAGLAAYLLARGRLTQLWDTYVESQSSLLEGMRHVGVKRIAVSPTQASTVWGTAAVIVAEDPFATSGVTALDAVHTVYLEGLPVYFGVDQNGIGYLYAGLLEPAMSGLLLPCVFTVLVGPARPWPQDVPPPDGVPMGAAS